MAFHRYGRGISSSLAASLLIHAVALGGLVVSARFLSPDAPDGPGAAGAAGAAGSGEVVLLRLLDVSAAPSQEVADDDGASTPAAGALPAPPQPARTAAPVKRTEPRRDTAGPAAALLQTRDSQTRDPVEVASALAAPSQPGSRPHAAAGTPASQPRTDKRSGTHAPAGGPLASAPLEPGGGREAGRLDRVARPAAPIRPHYPPRARQRGDEADVAVDVWVGAGGDVDRVAISRSAGAEFDAAAVAAVRRARFRPALRNGEQVPSRVALRLHFRLDR